MEKTVLTAQWLSASSQWGPHLTEVEPCPGARGPLKCFPEVSGQRCCWPQLQNSATEADAVVTQGVAWQEVLCWREWERGRHGGQARKDRGAEGSAELHLCWGQLIHTHWPCSAFCPWEGCICALGRQLALTSERDKKGQVP